MKTTDMIKIDGSAGEGGGQVLRTSLSLAMVTGQAFTIENIRAGRQRPGLMRQHLTCVKAAAEICGGEAEGAELGSGTLTFTPGRVKAGSYKFVIGTAGSTTLVAQTILPALMLADGPSYVAFEGGTHNMQCPPFDFLEKVFLPHMRAMGVGVDVNLARRGFFPAGGGQWVMDISPADLLRPIEITKRGLLQSLTAEAIVSQLPKSIASRELKTIGEKLELPWEVLHAVEDTTTLGPGNILQVTAAYEHVTEIFSGFGKMGVSAENIGKNTAKSAKRFINSKAAVGPYLADQLLLPMALAGGGCFTALRPSRHTITNIETIRQFLDVDIKLIEEDQGVWAVKVGA
jgi:RNA 3'-terminal phosphate cyclase (ATP)